MKGPGIESISMQRARKSVLILEFWKKGFMSIKYAGLWL